MSQRGLNLTFVDRDVVVCSRREDETVVCVYAYRVFKTSAGFGVVGQTLHHNRQMQVVAHLTPPMQLYDGFASEVEAFVAMAQHAGVKLHELAAFHTRQGEIVVLMSLEEVYDGASLP